MTTAEAIEYVLKNDPNCTKYALAKELGCHRSLVYHWHKGSAKMSERHYRKFKNIYPTVEITDVIREKRLGLK